MIAASNQLVLLLPLSEADLDTASELLLILTEAVVEQLQKTVPAQYFKFVFPLNLLTLLVVVVHFAALFLCCSYFFQSLKFLLTVLWESCIQVTTVNQILKWY